jgi:hypothetical protein
MTMTRAAFFAGAVVLASIMIACSGGSEPHGGGMSSSPPTPGTELLAEGYADASKTVYWTTMVVPEACEGDSVWYRLSLGNHVGPGLRFDPKALSPLLEVEVKAADGKVSRYAVGSENLTVLSFTRTPDLGKSMLDAVFDLQAVTGCLRPGKYEIVAGVPSKSYEIKTGDKRTPGDLKSPVRKLEIFALDKAKALEAAAWPVWIEMSGGEDGQVRVGTLKNTTDQPVLIGVGHNADALGRQELWCALLKWSPSGWSTPDLPRKAPYSYERQEPYYVSLPAGESLKVTLPEARSMGHGLFVYRVLIFEGTPQKPKEKLAGRSELFKQ